MNNDFLPIGSVVLLKDATKRIMITGFLMTDKNSGKTYDYAGCMYPEGMISSDETALFNHEQIDKVFFIGYQDVEYGNFIERLNKVLEEEKEKQKVDNNKLEVFDTNN